MLLVLTGDKGVGKKTIASILQKTSEFTLTTMESVDLEDFETRQVIVIETFEDFQKFLGLNLQADGITPTIIVEVTRSEEEIEKTISELEFYREHRMFTVDNIDIVKTIDEMTKLHDYCYQAYDFYHRNGGLKEERNEE